MRHGWRAATHLFSAAWSYCDGSTCLRQRRVGGFQADDERRPGSWSAWRVLLAVRFEVAANLLWDGVVGRGVHGGVWAWFSALS